MSEAIDSASADTSTTNSRSSEFVKAMDRLILSEDEWLPLSIPDGASARLVPALVELVTVPKAKKSKLKPRFVQEFALWAAAELMAADMDDERRGALFDKLTDDRLALDAATKSAVLEASGLSTGPEPLATGEPTVDSAVIPEPDTKVAEVEDALLVTPMVELAGVDLRIEGASAGNAEVDAQSEQRAQAVEEPQPDLDPTGETPLSEPPTSVAEEIKAIDPLEELVERDPELVRHAVAIADEIRTEIDRRRREERVIRMLAEELRASARALEETKRIAERLKASLSTRTKQKAEAVAQLERERLTTTALRGVADELRTEVASGRARLIEIQTILAAAQREHDFRIENQVPLRIQEAMGQLGSRISGVFANVRAVDGEELSPEHAVVLRELFKRLERILKDQGVSV